MRYSQSKLSNLLFSREINRKFNSNEIISTAVHPGFIASGLYDNTPIWFVAKKTWLLCGYSINFSYFQVTK